MNKIQQLWIENEFSENRNILKKCVARAAKHLEIHAEINPYDGSVDIDLTIDEGLQEITEDFTRLVLELYEERT